MSDNCFWQVCEKCCPNVLLLQRSIKWLSCLMHLPATLSIVPNRTQFFLYEKISLKCTMPADSNGWSMWRNVSATTSDTFRVQRVAVGVSYDILHAYPSDSGVYWCESPQGECSNKARITVTGNFNVRILLRGCLKTCLYGVLCLYSWHCDPGEPSLCVPGGPGDSSLSPEKGQWRESHFGFPHHVFQKWSLHRLDSQWEDGPPSCLSFWWGSLRM